MRIFQSLARRFRSIARPGLFEGEVVEELRSHFELLVEENIKKGMSKDEARRAAGVSFGSFAAAQAGCAEANGTQWLRQAKQDLHFGLRTLWKHKPFSIAVVVTLSIGIGTCAAMFSVVDAVLLRSLPYGNVDRIVYLYTPTPNLPMPSETFSPSTPDFLDIQRSSRSFNAMAQFGQQLYSMRAGSQLIRVGGATVSPDFFRTLGVGPQFGRLPGNTAAPLNGIVIAHSLWENTFNGSSDILGRSVFLDGKPYQIIGIMPSGFSYPNKTDLFGGGMNKIESTQVWVPLVQPPDAMTMRDGTLYVAVARLKAGVSLPQAELETRTIMAGLDHLHSDIHGWTALLKPLRETALGPFRQLLWLLQGAVAIVLLIACGNAAALLSSRAANRSQEMAMRYNLGASRGRLIRQLLTESLILSVAAGALGIVLASLSLHLVLQLDPGGIPRMQDASLNRSVVLFIVLITLLSNLLFSIIPAFSITRPGREPSLDRANSQHSRGRHRRSSDHLVVAQLALVVVLLTGAGLLIRSYQNVLKINTGVSSQTMATDIDLPFGFGRQRANDFFSQLTQELRAIPGIQNVGLADRLPLSGSGVAPILVDGFANRPDQLLEVSQISSDYLSAIQIPLLEGRKFRDDDPPTVAIVNEVFAKTYLHGRFTLNQRLRMSENDPWTRIVGVVPNIPTRLEEPPAPHVYLPITRTDIGGPFVASESIVLRTTLAPVALASAIQTTVRRLNPDLATENVRPIGDSISAASSARRFQVTLLSLFSLAALLLALIGLYGLLAYTVRLRTRELGVRMAIGATRTQILMLVLRQGLELFALGLVFGLAGSFLLASALSKALYRISAIDPATIGTVILILVVGTLLACLVPGARAAQISPSEALRAE